MTINNKSTIDYEKKRFSKVKVGETFIWEDNENDCAESENLFVKMDDYYLGETANHAPYNAFSLESDEPVRFEDNEIVVMVTAEVNFTLNRRDENDI